MTPKPRKELPYDYSVRRKRVVDLAAEYADLRTRTPEGRG